VAPRGSGSVTADRLVPRAAPSGIAGRLFDEVHHWQPEPAPEAPDDARPNAIELALRLLTQIAEDPYVRGSHRVAARRYLHRLEAQTAGAAAAT
jgi:hypothetical protein